MQWRRQLSWEPGSLDWRVAALFMTGAFVFALGSFPPYAELVDARVVGATFVGGSLLFTSAGYSQFLQVINTGDGADPRAGPESFRFWAWQTRSTLWWATSIQLAGTVFFNFSTIDAMIGSLTTKQAERLVWAPDFFGSIAFLIASHLAWRLVCKRIWCVQRDDADWWTASLNYVGSIFFMLSALAAFILPTNGEVVNLTVVNSATFVGAACFFVGAYLLLPPNIPRPVTTKQT
jgi:hypothetical protein